MSTVKEFTPVLMYVDHERIDASTKSANEFAEKINTRFRLVEDLLDKKLQDEYLLRLAKEGIKFLDGELAKLFQFKNATKQFNLEAMGKVQEYENAKKALMNFTGFITAYDFEIKEGVAKLSSKGEKAIIEMNTHYTKNDAQNEALELAKSMVKDLNKGIDLNLIQGANKTDIMRGNPLVKVAERSRDFVPNFVNISRVREDGRMVSLY